MNPYLTCNLSSFGIRFGNKSLEVLIKALALEKTHLFLYSLNLPMYYIYSYVNPSLFLIIITHRVFIPIQIFSSEIPSMTNKLINYFIMFSKSSKGVSSIIDSAKNANSHEASLISGLKNFIIIV